MEWVETTGKTVAEATETALLQLGVADDDAEIEVLDEPKSGLFGRVRSEARVRARVRPQSARPKDERRRRKPAPVSAATPSAVEETADDVPVAKFPGPRKRAVSSATAAAISAVGSEPSPAASPRSTWTPAKREPGSSDPEVGAAVVEEVRRIVEGFLAAIDVAATVTVTALPESGADVAIQGQQLGFLIGPKAVTLLAVQDLVRTVTFRKFGHDLGRINLDIAGYRERRRQALAEFTLGVAQAVLAEGSSRALEPMNAADRKVVHDTINDIAGISSRSEGEDPFRRVVLVPSSME